MQSKTGQTTLCEFQFSITIHKYYDKYVYKNTMPYEYMAQSARAAEYTDCISADGLV